MLWTRSFIPTLRESPADAETAAQKLLVRAGYARPVSTGVYGWLPLGQRALEKIRRVARQEIEALGGQEVHLTEGAAAAIAQGELRSPKQLPQIWFRFEAAPLRARQLLGMEIFSFGADPAALDSALRRVPERCGISFRDAGDALLAVHESGVDTAVACSGCGYVATPRTVAGVPSAPPADPEGDLAPEEFHTPGLKTIAAIANFTGLPESMQMKSLVLVAQGKPVLVMLRGDHQLSEAKFPARPATPEEIMRWFGAQAGSLGPVGVRNMPVLADRALAGRRNMICGANRDDYHLRHVTPGEDFEAEFRDLREVAAGEACTRCGGTLEFRPAIELARMSAGVRRLSIERILTTAIELANDKDGMILPPAIAPFDVVITAAIVSDGAERIYRDCLAAGLDALYDDRDERPGVKFKDADLIGVPVRINVGKKLADGLVEMVDRGSRQMVEIPAGEVPERVRVRVGTSASDPRLTP
ncbi:MAG TPA: YbaK/EbsC family protein [Candidatus Acidoferrales bacterium]|nr:YbaK/EbsC family protein [Candidatus Acidoferrales bacterium]